MAVGDMKNEVRDVKKVNKVTWGHHAEGHYAGGHHVDETVLVD